MPRHRALVLDKPFDAAGSELASKGLAQHRRVDHEGLVGSQLVSVALVSDHLVDRFLCDRRVALWKFHFLSICVAVATVEARAQGNGASCGRLSLLRNGAPSHPFCGRLSIHSHHSCIRERLSQR
eukprot:scaffold83230_cov62-Phaeocystis_antarctica.AAC.3